MHVMLDLETMSTKPDAAIIAIGACTFNHEKVVDQFYAKVSLQSSFDLGGVMDPRTVLWWLKQSEEARSEFGKENDLHINSALSLYSQWFVTVEGKEVWGCGASFDNVILRTAYERSGQICPWNFWDDRCYRTIKSMPNFPKLERKGTHHNALDDAVYQAECLIASGFLRGNEF